MPSQRRWAAALTAGVIEAILVLGLVLGLAAPRVVQREAETLTAVNLEPPPPPPPPPERQRPGRIAGGAPKAVVREAEPPPPLPQVPIALPNIPAAPSTGSGSGGGLGGKGAGTGAGDGAGDDAGSDPDWIKGRITDRDYPREAREARAQGETRTRIAVGADGRPTACRVRGSSGSALLDETTCRLILQRFRFAPARDGAGRAVAAEVDYDQDWRITGYLGE